MNILRLLTHELLTFWITISEYVYVDSTREGGERLPFRMQGWVEMDVASRGELQTYVKMSH